MRALPASGTGPEMAPAARVKRASDCQNFMRLSLINFSSETPGERETRILTQKICAQCGYGRSLTSKP